MLETYRGSCHCGAVQFEADLDLTQPTFRCNCSICRRSRFWVAVAQPQGFRLLAGADMLRSAAFCGERIGRTSDRARRRHGNRESRVHAGALGMRFYTGTKFPQQYRGAIFIAEHGSRNRSQKIGYRISVVSNLDQPTYKPFAERWLQGQSTRGRRST